MIGNFGCACNKCCTGAKTIGTLTGGLAAVGFFEVADHKIPATTRIIAMTISQKLLFEVLFTQVSLAMTSLEDRFFTCGFGLVCFNRIRIIQRSQADVGSFSPEQLK